MAVRYGAEWLNRWQGIDIDAVKRDWAEELAGVSASAMKFAVVNLPIGKPPSVGEFKAICLRAPDLFRPAALDAPKADPERVARIVARLRERIARREPMQWAFDLQEREKRGESMTAGQMVAWREALRKAEEPKGWFTPIDPQCLPPGMRPAEQDAAFQRAEDQALDQFYGEEQA
jgi:hypothetical protein